MKFFKKLFLFTLSTIILITSLVSFVSCKAADNPTEIKNVIIVIGDGMGANHITAGEYAFNKDYAFTNWQSIDVNTNSISALGEPIITTDSAASGTALATGTLTLNGYVGKDINQQDLTTILDIAKQQGKKTGVITTDYLDGATPGGFSAHSVSRTDGATITLTQIQSNVDLLVGHYREDYIPYQGLIADYGYTYLDSFSQFTYNKNASKIYGLIDLEGNGGSVKLKDLTSFALDYLDNENGFTLMVEQAHVDKFSHSNDFNGAVKMVNSLNDTVDTILSWMGDRKDTLILVTADHETGGLYIDANEDLYQDKYTSVSNKTFSYAWTSTNHTPSFVKLYCYSPILEDLTTLDTYNVLENCIKNIDVFNLSKKYVENKLYAE
jgi:alkaline phosphatase